MKVHHPIPFRFVLPLPSFVLRPLTAAVVAAVHVYLAAGHLSQLIVGDVQWTGPRRPVSVTGRCFGV